MNDRDLENIYREFLEEDIIFCLSERRRISYKEAMKIYYSSRFSYAIFDGLYGIQYLNYTVLANEIEKDLNGRLEQYTNHK